MKATLQQVTASDQQSFRVFRREETQFAFHWHQHPEVELTSITAGRGQRFTGDHVEDYAAGDLVLIGPNLPHTWRSQGKGPHAATVIQFNPNFAGEGFLALPELRAIDQLIARARRGIKFCGRGALAVAQALDALPDNDPLHRFTGLIEALSTLAEIRNVHVLSSPQVQPQVRAIDEERIARACDFVDTHLDQVIRLNEVAQQVGMSAASFSRYFKQHTGRTLVAYINELRIGQACRLLVETEDPITEIAYAIGFNNLSNFNRRFQQMKQRTPRAYREAYRGRG